MTDLMEYEAEQVATANASGKKPIVFVHGLWLLPSSWDRWAEYFEAAGFSTVTAGWPDDPNAVDEANRHPEVFAKKSVQQVADHVEGADPGAEAAPGRHRPLVRRAARRDPRRPRLQRRLGRHLPRAAPGRPAAPDLGAALVVTRAAQPPQPRPRGPAHLRAVPLRVRQRGERRGGPRAVQHVRGAGRGAPALPGRQRQPQPVDRGQGQDQEPRSRPAADRRRAPRTTPSRGRSATRRSSASGATRTRSPRSSSSRTAATRSPSTTVGRRSPTPR